MYTQNKISKTTINLNQSYEGETLEQKISRMVNNKEPIKDSAPLIYTERKDGVQPAYDIRTDRFDLALDALDSVSRARAARRDSVGQQAKEGMDKETPNTPPIDGNQQS